MDCRRCAAIFVPRIARLWAYLAPVMASISPGQLVNAVRGALNFAFIAQAVVTGLGDNVAHNIRQVAIVETVAATLLLFFGLVRITTIYKRNVGGRRVTCGALTYNVDNAVWDAAAFVSAGLSLTGATLLHVAATAVDDGWYDAQGPSPSCNTTAATFNKSFGCTAHDKLMMLQSGVTAVAISLAVTTLVWPNEARTSLPPPVPVAADVVAGGGARPGRVTWPAVQDTRVVGYTVYYRDSAAAANPWNHEFVTANILHYDPAPTGHPYDVNVCAIGIDGSVSAPSATVHVQT